MNWFISKILPWIGNRFNGYKTKIGGVGLIIIGVVGIINLLWPGSIPDVPAMDIDGIITSISGGFVAIGIGHKIDKNTSAVQEATNAGIKTQDQQGTIAVTSSDNAPAYTND